MKNFRTTTALALTLLVALSACGTSGKASDRAADVPTTASTVVSTTVVAQPVEGEPVTVPVVTTPPVTTPPVTTPPTSPPVTTPADKKPVFNSFSVSAGTPCFPEVPDYQYPDLTISWDISGATSVYVALDNEFGPWEQNLPAVGSLTVPAPGCSDDQTYYVVAENAFGRTVKQEARTAS